MKYDNIKAFNICTERLYTSNKLVYIIGARRFNKFVSNGSLYWETDNTRGEKLWRIV